MQEESPPKESKMTLRFTPELHARIRAIADKEHRSLHGQVVRFLEEGADRWMREQGQQAQ